MLCLVGNCCVESRSDDVEARLRTVPSQFVYVTTQRNIGTESREPSEQESVIALAGERLRECTRIDSVHPPHPPVHWDEFEMEEFGENSSR